MRLGKIQRPLTESANMNILQKKSRDSEIKKKSVFISGKSVVISLIIIIPVVWLSGCAGISPDSGADKLPAEETIAVAEPSVLDSYSSAEDAGDLIKFLLDKESLSLEEKKLLLALYITDQKYDAAFDMAVNILSEEPGDGEVLYNLVLACDGLEKISERDERLDELLKLFPSHTEGLVFKGNLMMREKDYKGALEPFSDALRSDPDNFMALLGRADCLMRLDMLEEAVLDLDKAEKVDPDYPYIYIDRSRALTVLRQYGRALEDLDTAIALQPDVEWHYLDRARLRLRYFHDTEGALDDLLNVERINPENLFAHIYLGGVYDEMKLYDEALSYYIKVKEKRPDYEFVYPSMGKIYYMKEDWAAADEAFTAASLSDPDNFSYPLMAFLAQSNQGEKQDGIRWLKQAISRLDRQSTEYEMYRYYIEGGSDFYILDRLTREEDEDIRDRLYFFLGEKYRQQGMDRSAIASFAKIAEKKGAMEYELAQALMNS